MIMPDLIRKREEKDLRKFFLLRKQTLELAHKKSMTVVDSCDVVNEYRQKMGTPYAGFVFFIDHSHLSAFGTQMVADRIRFLNPGVPPAVSTISAHQHRFAHHPRHLLVLS